jgi:Mn2+/Fe2+ NRAMP family transporter
MAQAGALRFDHTSSVFLLRRAKSTSVAMTLGLTLNYLSFNAVKMLFWSAVINGLLAPPLILLLILLTSS